MKVNQQFKQLPKTGKPIENEYTILSGILVNDECVALATGMRCLNSYTHEGYVVNDSHAEILCRRSFCRYIYHEMLSCMDGKDSILELKSQDSEYPFCLRENTCIQLYISQAPCGDASMHMLDMNQSQSERQANEAKRLKFDETNAKSILGITGDVIRGRLYYERLGVARTKPGRLDSQSTLSMSCSDKIAKWNALGLNGALLSQLIAPINLNSISVGDGYHYESMDRALVSRLEMFRNQTLKPKLEHWTDVFQFSLSSIKHLYPEKIPKPCVSAIVWNKYEKSHVLINGERPGRRKKDIGYNKNFISNLSKIAMYKLFMRVVDDLKSKVSFSGLNIDKNSTYRDCKNTNVKYQNAKDELKKSVFKGWVSKDSNCEIFTWNDINNHP